MIVPNGSFENGIAPWAVKGTGQIAELDETAPWRGASYARLSGTMRSPAIRASPSTACTTTSRLRAAAIVEVRFPSCRRKPIGARRFAFAGSGSRFAPLVAVDTTPNLTCFVTLEIAGDGMDVDEVR